MPQKHITPAEFAERTKVDVKLAKRILDALATRNLDVASLNSIIWRIERKITDEALAEKLNKTTPEEIDSAISDMILESTNGLTSSNYSETIESIRTFSELLFSEKKEFKAGDEVKIQIMRTGEWDHPRYGEFKVTTETLNRVKKNFEENKLGRECYVDENHEDDHKALGWISKVYFEGKSALWGAIELTARGAKLLSEGAYKYFSPEIFFKYENPENGETIKDLLVGGAFTNTPFFKGMQALKASEVARSRSTTKDTPITLFLNPQKQMNKFLQKVAEFAEKGTLAANRAELTKEFSTLSAEEQKSLKNELVNSFGFKFDDPAPAADPAPTPAEPEKPADPAPADPATPAEPASDVTPEEKKEVEAEPVDEPVEDDEEEEPAEQEKEETLKASELNALREKAKKFEEYERAQKFAEIEKTISPFIFSEGNKDARVPAKYKEKLTKIALSLSEKKRAWFFEILKDVRNFGELTKELGSDKPAEKLTSATALAKFNDLVASEVKGGMTQYDAMVKVGRENRELQALIG